MFDSISIHTPAKGVTALLWEFIYVGLYFNPHSREGSDVNIYALYDSDIISIHTPAKGVTLLLLP